ncbi:MAG TPA: DUF1801 domain-containing protein [Vicingaceae bacterium]|nr:DUF1801 domain-containing protein [Vicingaceae bacterium]
MQIQADTPEEYVEKLPEDRKEVIQKIRTTVNKVLPKGFKETVGYGMIGWVVPHSIYPSGYHCDPKQPLPFMGVASQKNHIGFYHMGIYADEQLLNWFTENYPKHCKTKLDMGKSCIRFKKPENIPFELISQLVAKMTVEDWIKLYESNLKR